MRVIHKGVRKMKKTICILLAVFLACAISACGKNQDETGTTEPAVSYASAQEVTGNQVIASVSSAGSPKYAMSPEDSHYIRTLLSREMRETDFSGNADYEITVSGSTFYYDAKTGEFGNSSVITLSGKEKETFEKTLEKYFENKTEIIPAGSTTFRKPVSFETEKNTGTTVAYTGQSNTVKQKNTASPSIQYIRANEIRYSDTAYPKVVFIKSADELNAYKSSKSSDYYFDSGSGSTESFNEATAEYDDDFFKDKAIVMVVTRESSGSNYYDGVNVNGKEGIIAVYRFCPEVGTADMASWHIIIELDRNDAIFNYSPSKVQVLMSE